MKISNLSNWLETGGRQAKFQVALGLYKKAKSWEGHHLSNYL